MSRTKEEMISILSQRLVSKQLTASTWSDLVDSISGSTQNQKDNLVRKLAQNRHKEAGEMLSKALLINAEQRAKAEVDALLQDDVLTLAELDTLI